MWPARDVRPRVTALVALSLLASACANDDGAVLDVYAASSLTEAFTEMEQAFETAHPGIDARVTFAGSQVLRVQIEQGARADVFASANPDHVAALAAAGLVGVGGVFAGNDLVVITPLGNPAGIQSFGDLPRASRLVIGTESVPVGAYAREAIRRGTVAFGPGFGSDVGRRIVSEEPNARLVRAKVEMEEADAALVYRTDAAGSDRIRVVPIPPEFNVRAAYTMAPVGESLMASEVSSTASDVAAWIAFVLSDQGQAVMARHGFLPVVDVDS